MSNPTIKINNKQVAGIYTSSGWLSKIENSNSTVIWEKTDIPISDLCITILEPDIKNYLYIKLTGGTNSITYTLNYSFISGSIFSSITTNSEGDGYINFSTNNSIFLQSTQFPSWVDTSATYYTSISCKRRTGDTPNVNNDEDIPFIISGNVDSLGMYSSFLPANVGYSRLFASSKLVDASMLILRYTGFANDTIGYRGMFANCESLIKAPVLPATTLTDYCYNMMFINCTSLTTAPALPATTLAENCYSNMFQGCTSLTTAPDLLATTLVNRCYHRMFYGCTNLNYIKCTAENNVSTNNTEDWTYGVSALSPIYNQHAWSSSGNVYFVSFTQNIPSDGDTIYVKFSGSIPHNTSFNNYRLAFNMNSTRCSCKKEVNGSLFDYYFNTYGGFSPNIFYEFEFRILNNNEKVFIYKQEATSGTFYKKAGVSWTTGESGIPSGWNVIEV